MIFDNFNWHDVLIKEVFIDRNTPGVNDSIRFLIKFPELENDSYLTFEEVYRTKMMLNFGIITDETILYASELNEDEELYELYKDWKGLISDIKLKSYKLILNSTNSSIKILSKDFKIEHLR